MIDATVICSNLTNRSLLLFDELGQGTSSYDGVSIAWSVVEYIHNHPRLRSHTPFATHYHELTQLADLLPGVRNYNVAVSETDWQGGLLHKVIHCGSDRFYGVHVAKDKKG